MIKTIAERLVYENPFARVYDDDVQFPDGGRGTYLRNEWKAPHGVAIVPLIEDDILLIRHYRYTEQCYVIEIPQGFGTDGSTPEEDARRELLEETACIAVFIEPMFKTGHRWVTHVFAARIEPGSIQSIAFAERSEAIVEFIRVPRAEMTIRMMAHLGIRETTTIAALLHIASSQYDRFGIDLPAVEKVG